MGKIYSDDGWIIKVHGDEHPPVHAYVLHSDGKATISVEGEVVNSGVPAKVVSIAKAWILENRDVLTTEWQKMNNPRKR